MSIKTHTLSFNILSGTSGNVSVTGVGFKPTLIKIMGYAPNSLQNDFRFGMGAASGPTTDEQFCLAIYATTGGATTQNKKTFRDLLFFALGENSAVTHEMTLVSFDNDGFTVNLATATPTNISMNVVLIDLVDVAVSKFWLPNVNGNVTATGLAFQPTAIEVFPEFSSVHENVNSDARITMGAATASQQYCITVASEDSVSTTVTSRFQTSSSIMAVYNTIAGAGETALSLEYDFVGFTSDGFTLNAVAAVGFSQNLSYIAYGAANAKVGTFTQPVADSTVSVTGVGFQPDVTFFAGIQNPTFDESQGDNRLFVGVGSDSAQSSVSVWDDDAQTNTTSSRINSETNCIVQHASYTDAYNQPHASYEASEVDGFSLSWLYTDTIGRNTFYLSLAEDAVSDTTAPVITLDGGTYMEVERGDTYSDPTYTITDDTDSTRTTGAVITGTVDTSTVGYYYRYFNAEDAAGNDASQVTLTVEVVYTPEVGDVVPDADENNWTYVGSFFVDDGPHQSLPAPSINGLQAAEEVFGTLPDEVYATSTVPHLVNRLANYDSYSGAATTGADDLDTYGSDGLYNSSGDLSAYVDDKTFEVTTYVFKRAVSTGTNNLNVGSSEVLDVKYFNGTNLVDVELQLNETIVWKV